ncbi:MAG: sensor histidine kinase [Nitrospiraceae bacterium]|nr:sensor histidine kinase [Nitrospiraceae bacterium]
MPVCSFQRRPSRASFEPDAGAPRWREELILAAGGILACLFFVLDLHLPLGVANGVLYSLVVVLAGVSERRTLPAWTALACSILHMVGTVLGPSLPGLPTWFGWGNHLLGLFSIWVPVLFVFQRRRTEALLKEANERLEQRVSERTADLAESRLAIQRNEVQLHALTGRILTAQEEERRRIARDLHDDVNQRLAILTLGLQGVERRNGSVPDEVQREVRSALRGLAALSDDVRHMAYRYHPSILDDLGLEAALQRLLDEFSARTGIKTLFVRQPLDPPPGKSTATALYRVVQECLSNIVRHADASRVEVELTGGGEEVELVVRDNGIGFQPQVGEPAQGGLGLLNIRERLLALDGHCRIESAPGQGTTVSVHVPIGEVHP